MIMHWLTFNNYLLVLFEATLLDFNQSSHKIKL